MNSADGLRIPEREGQVEGGTAGAVESPVTGAFPPAEQRLLRLMAEFRRRQREHADLVVRPWISHDDAAVLQPTIGFVVEYCPGGTFCAEVRVRWDGAVAEGPLGAHRASLSLQTGWLIDGRDVRGPELMVNHLLRLAEGTFERV